MVVEAHRVVAGAREALRRAARGVVVGEVRVEAEVDAVEALRDAGPALELEVRAARDDAAVRAGGGVVRDDVREVERGAGLDVRVDGDRDPVGPRLDAVRDEALQRARLRPGERERERAPLAGGEAPGAEDEPELVDGRPPAAVVLEQDLRRLGEREREGLAPLGVADRHRAYLPPEEAGGGGVLAPQRHLGAVEGRRPARVARKRERAGDAEAGELRVAVGRERPFGAHRAVLLAVGGAAVERRAVEPDREGVAARAVLLEGERLLAAPRPVRAVGDGMELDRHVGDREPPHVDADVGGGGGKRQRGDGGDREDSFHGMN